MNKKLSLNNILSGVGSIGRVFNRAQILLSLIGIGTLLLYIAGNSGSNTSTVAEQQHPGLFPCPVTADEYLETLPSNDLQTAQAISSVDIGKEVLGANTQTSIIPAIDNPQFTHSSQLDACIDAQEEVITVSIGGVTKIYPHSIIDHHLAIDDEVHGVPVLIVYCPLCNSYAVYDREYKNEIMSFGVSGELYKNSDLLYDQKTNSLWSGFSGQALIGTLTGAKLDSIPFRRISYLQAKADYPQARILSFDTGFRMNYAYDPFASFATSSEILQQPTNSSKLLPEKQSILGLHINGLDYAIADSDVTATATFTTKINQKILTISRTRSGEITALYGGNSLTVIQAFWYVWFDFYPQTQLFTQ